jgi:hypothetical protein
LAIRGEIACLNRPLVKVRKHSQQVSRDNHGRTQLIYGLAAGVCHFLRAKGYEDPSAAPRYWEDFIDWLVLRIEEDGLFNRKKAWGKLRKDYLAAENKLVGAYKVCFGLFRSSYWREIIKEKTLGSDFAERTAEQWIQANKCAAS